jgi:pilus assembly protein Flp/PilA
MTGFFTHFVWDDSGATAIEYGMIAALISVMCIGATTVAGQQLLTLIDNIGNTLAGAL